MSKAVQDAQNFIRMYRSFNAMVETLAEFGSVEDALQRATNEKADAIKNLADIKDNIMMERRTLSALKVEAKNFEESIIEMKAAASAKRDQMIADGEKIAAAMVEDAKAQVAKIIADAAAEVNALGEKAAILKEHTQMRQAEHDAVVAALDALKAKING